VTTRRRLIAALLSGTASLGTSAQLKRPLPLVALVFNAVPLADMLGPDPVDYVTRDFVDALRDLGLVDGRDIVIVRRSAEGRPERMPALMKELVAQGVDVIVATGPAAIAAQAATQTIPIVALVGDPVRSGLAATYARPGGNLTAVTSDGVGALSKELQLLKEIAPKVSHVAMIAYSPQPGQPRAAWRIDIEAMARALNMKLLWLGVDTVDDFQPAFDAILRNRADAIVDVGTPINERYQRRLMDFASSARLPAIGDPDLGALLIYQSGVADAYRRAAAYVDKILKGAKPADLPVDQAMRYELVVNRKAARALGLTIPQSILLRADRVIE
jgi:putative ABC transport system substrate-binding protein